MSAENKEVVLITGASSGIGEACAYAFAKRGFALILVARREEELQQVKLVCEQLGARCMYIPFDLSRTDRMEELMEEAIQVFGRIDILFLNAGVSQRALTTECSIEMDRALMEINYFSVVAMTKWILPYFIKRGGGTLAVTTSIAGKFGFPLRSAYAASKHALYGFFETVEAEYADKQVHVVMVCPGRVCTHISKNALEADGKAHAQLDEGQKSAMSAEKAAKIIVNAIVKRKHEVYVGGREILMVYIKRFLPSLSRYLVRKIRAT